MEEQPTQPQPPAQPPVAPTPPKRLPRKKLILGLFVLLLLSGGVCSVLAWRTTYLDNLLPAGVKEFFGRGEEAEKREGAEKEEAKVGEAVSVGGLLLTVNKAERVVEEGKVKDILVLTITFENRGDCPPPESGSSECRYDTRGFRLVDEEGFVLDQPVKYPTIEYYETDPLSQLVLKAGEKDQGHVFFEIPKDKNKFFLTYTQFQETSSKILIEPETFGPTKNWKTYKNEKYAFEIKYPTNATISESKYGVDGLYERVRIIFIGTSQEQKEYVTTDGYMVEVVVYESEQAKGLLDSLKEYDKDDCYPGFTCSDLTTTEISGFTAQTYSQTSSGEYIETPDRRDHYYVEKGERLYHIEVQYAGKESYNQTSNQILATFKFL